jgi:hypothetical protein
MKIPFFILLFTIFNFGFALSQTNVSGAYFSNETWTQAQSPYQIIGDVQIPIGYTLTIEPGVTVEYTGQFEILVKGGLNAVGTQNDSIMFSCSSGISTGVTALRFVDVDLSNSQLSYAKFSNHEKALNVQGSCSNTLNVNSTYFKSSIILNESENINFTINNSEFDDMLIECNYLSDNSTTLIDNSIVDNSHFKTRAQTVGGPSLSVQNSNVNNTTFHSSCTLCSNAQMEVFNLACNNCTFGTWYGKIIINDSQLNNSGFNNHNFSQSTQVNIDVNRSVLVNTSIESSITNPSNQWWSTINIDRCIIQKDSSTILGYHVGDVSNSIIIGTGSNVGVQTLRGNFSNVTIVNNEIGIVREEDPLIFSISNSNLFQNSTYNIQNNSLEDISAPNNYWGTTNSVNIGDLIYDYYDDINLGEVLFTTHASTPNPNCPISPPSNLSIADINGDIQLSWMTNPEVDVLGYKLNFGLFDGFDFQHSIDIGNVTTYIVPDSIMSDTLAITAYDSDIDNVDDKIDGNESWYSLISRSELNNVSNSNIEKNYGFNVFPNPVNNILNVEALILDNLIKRIDIININGVLESSLNVNKKGIKQLDFSGYSKGIYFVKVIVEDTIYIQKVLKI